LFDSGDAVTSILGQRSVVSRALTVWIRTVVLQDYLKRKDGAGSGIQREARSDPGPHAIEATDPGQSQRVEFAPPGTHEEWEWGDSL